MDVNKKPQKPLKIIELMRSISWLSQFVEYSSDHCSYSPIFNRMINTNNQLSNHFKVPLSPSTRGYFQFQ